MSVVDAVVLAAGSSIRFGSDKRLYVVEGVPMLQCAIAAVVGEVRTVYIALQESDRPAAQQLLGEWFQDDRIIPVFVDNPQQGMGSNLAKMVAQLPPDCEALLVMLADLPQVQVATVQAVRAKFRQASIIVPVTATGRHGHPVLFAREFFPALLRLSGDVGARGVLQQAKAVIEVVVDDDGIWRDIDLPLP